MTDRNDTTMRFALGTLDTPQRTQTMRQARKTFFLQLNTLVPEAIAELRDIPLHAHEGEIVNKSTSSLPTFTSGQWVDLRDLAIPPAVADQLRANQIPPGWSPADTKLYTATALHLFVPKTVMDWATHWRLESEFHWVAAFGTLVRIRWRHKPKQPLAEVLATLGGFPILHPYDTVRALRFSVKDLPEYPALSPADPRSENQRKFLTRARDHYRDASTYVNRYLKPIRRRDLTRYSNWLIRFQVRGHTKTAIAGPLTRQAVTLGIREIAAIIGLRFEPPGRGRPVGRKDSWPRHRAVR